jgi:hypothetical protein
MVLIMGARMKICLSPVRSDEVLSVSRLGDSLTINGEVFDFSRLLDGEIIPDGAIDSFWFFGPVERIAGELHLTLRLPHGKDPSPDAAYPQPIDVSTDGAVEVPR